MKYFFLVLLTFLFTDCSKDAAGTKINCESLREGLLSDDASLVKNSLGDLLSMKYTAQNFNTFTDSIANSCDITVEASCFNCVQTLPPQSEIDLALLDNNGDSTLRILSFWADADSGIKLLGIEQ